MIVYYGTSFAKSEDDCLVEEKRSRPTVKGKREH